MDLFTPQDIFLVPIELLLLLSVAFLFSSKLSAKSDRTIFFTALFFRLLSVTIFCLIYALHYDGGDTVNYYYGSKALVNLAFVNPSATLSILGNNLSLENFMAFTNATTRPPYYMYIDPNTFSVIRFSALFCFLGAKSFLCTNYILAFVTFVGPWKLFQLFRQYYPGIERQLAICILFIPSVLFWCSGIMKDSYTLSATCWIVVNFHRVMLERKRVFRNLIMMVINAIIIVNIKPYILVSLFPGLLLWVNHAYIKQLSNKIIRVFATPFMVLIIGGVGFATFQTFQSYLGEYGNLDRAIHKAKIVQEDLLREEQYGTNSYNIGEIDGTFTGMLKLAPIAIFTAIFRPLINEVGSPLMILSVLENTVLLLLTVFTLIRFPFRLLLKILTENPLVMFAISFSMFFAFGVGIAATNFGALVRYRAPLVPFFYSAIFILRYLKKQAKQEPAASPLAVKKAA